MNSELSQQRLSSSQNLTSEFFSDPIHISFVFSIFIQRPEISSYSFKTCMQVSNEVLLPSSIMVVSSAYWDITNVVSITLMPLISLNSIFSYFMISGLHYFIDLHFLTILLYI